MKQFTSKTQKIGEIGEKIAEMFLVKQGFTIIDRNFTHKLGEIDFIAKKSAKIYFFEVKSIIGKNRKNIIEQEPTTTNVTRETYINNVSRVTNYGIRQKSTILERETPVKHIKSRLNTDKGQIKDTQDVSDVYKNVVGTESSVALTKVSCETYNPFENMSYSKMRKFSKVVEIYLAQKRVSRETKWQIDGLGVVLTKNPETGKVVGRVTRLESINIK